MRTPRAARGGRRRRPEVVLGTLAIAVGCRGKPQSEPRPSPAVVLARGDVVVVEKAAAEFFQARVLSVADGTIRVQTSEDGEPMSVARSDAYRVPPEPHVFAQGDPAICAASRAHWTACRITSTETDSLDVTLDTGEQLRVERQWVLAPSAVTALDITRHFETTAARRDFDVEARAAGAPVRPPGWIPEKKEPVIARNGGDWYSAHADGLVADGGVRVVWDGKDHAEVVPGDVVVPAPPVTHIAQRAQFALTRPVTASEPWERVRVEAVGADQAVCVGVDGVKRRLELRNLVPLVPRGLK